MGGVVSTGQDNDDLVDNLKEAEYIKTSKVEQVFRIVDRAHYYLPESRDNAYKDLAWKSGTLHLSAPCIYSEVMEALNLKQGLSFLNLGSGTGYLNTMVGFMIGPNGINHGIELHAENVEYAEERLKDFKEKSKKFDDLEFGEPTFVQGNCLNLAPDNRRYDRVYCGAACPPDLKSTIQNLLKINGILVMPVGDQLLKIKRINETDFTADNVLPVSFASLYIPPNGKEPADLILMPEVNPISLQNQCAVVVRNSIRQNFSFDIPDSRSKENKKQTSRLQQEPVRLPLNFLPTAQRLMIMGAFGHSDDSNSDDDQTDESYLDLQLQRHAQERQRAEERRRKERNKGNTEEVDSCLSDEEMDEQDDEHSGDRKSARMDCGNNNNGNSNSHGLKSVSEDVESMDSEDGIVADDEDDEDDEFDDKLKDLSYGFGKQDNQSSHTHSRLKCTSCSSTVHETPSKSKENRSVSNVYKGSEHVSAKSKLILSSDEEDQLVANAAPSSTGPIQVITTSYPRRYKTSYSTSAEASETSGFGSLGDDTFQTGSLQSNSVFCDSRDEDGDITDETSFDDAGVFSSDRAHSPKIEKSPSLKCPGNTGQSSGLSNSHENKIIEEEDMDENENDDINSGHLTSTDEEDLTSSEEDDDDDDIDTKIKYTPSEPRGPDFTAFLRKQVETLPIPNSLKTFILRYR